METLVKFIKELFFNDEKIDIKAVTKFRYILVGIVIGIVLTFVGLYFIADDDEIDYEPTIELVDE